MKLGTLNNFTPATAPYNSSNRVNKNEMIYISETNLGIWFDFQFKVNECIRHCFFGWFECLISRNRIGSLNMM